MNNSVTAAPGGAKNAPYYRQPLGFGYNTYIIADLTGSGVNGIINIA
jgi:hypothetical protein